jgi:hypothetical protein
VLDLLCIVGTRVQARQKAVTLSHTSRAAREQPPSHPQALTLGATHLPIFLHVQRLQLP